MKTHSWLFDDSTVKEWITVVKTEPDETFTSFIEKSQNSFFERRVNRMKALQTSMIDKMRDSSGKIQLSEGFEKNCGLKGSKLSGG